MGWTFLTLTVLVAAGQVACTGVIQGNSPPAGSPTPNPKAELDCRARQVPAVALRRLTREQYANSVRDLLRLSQPFDASTLAGDEKVGPFLSNVVTAVGDLMVQQYMEAAERAGRLAVQSLDRILPCQPAQIGEAPCAAQFITEFGQRAYRRPLSSSESQRYSALYATHSGSGGFANGVRLVIQTMLQSPNFLYHLELPVASLPAGEIRPLTGYELASRLSFFIWNSIPDANLFAAAASGSLGKDAELRSQVQRMLRDAKAKDSIASFHLQWLGLEKMGGLSKDPAIYPSFNATLRDAMRAETIDFADHVLRRGDGRLETLFTASYSILSDPLLGFYGAQRSAGQGPSAPVALDPNRRAGILSRAGFLAGHAHVNQSSPVKRGVIIRRNLLCQALPDPPPNVVTDPPKLTPGMTTRERLAAHQTSASCAGCHKLIDGVGFGFENYDGVGAFRQEDGGKPVDASGNLTGTLDVDGSFVGAVELGRKLAGSKEVHQCLTRQWFRFALGRLETQSDACSLQQAGNSFAGSGQDMRALLESIAVSDAFRFQRVPQN